MKARETHRSPSPESMLRSASQNNMPARPPVAPVWALIFHQCVISIAVADVSAAPMKKIISHSGAWIAYTYAEAPR